ncbi:hypothetical protein [Jiangella alba]|uniref:DUF4367 domain-containing protein n=1 Tax=Jiangella alba TaxID=561176 RepID=A0A1H5PWV3_9ACTN|nr:hypothetical protein [Jiangella alba]SEF18276.1 hypothetical protein SAMN04488561_6330 [Jiangella alba]
MDDALERELRALGRSAATAIDDAGPAPAEVATSVLNRLDTSPAPARAAWWRRTPDPAARWPWAAGQVTRLRLAAGRIAQWSWGAGPGRRLAVVAVAVLVALGLTAPVRAAVGEWLGIGAVAVRPGPSQPSASAPQPAPAGLSLDAAAERTGLTPVVPPVLGAPDGVEVSADDRVLSLSWGSGPGTVRLDQVADPLSPVYLKTAVLGSTATTLTVAGRDAWWFGVPHDLVLLAPDGRERTESARVAGPTLVWVDDGVTFRLEGAGDRGRAVEIAASALGTG